MNDPLRNSDNQRVEDLPLYNSKITKNYIDYLKQYYPDIDTSEILEYAGITIYQIEDGGHWLSQQQVNRFHEILIKKTNNENLPLEVGRQVALSRASLPSQQLALGFITPKTAYKFLEKLYASLSRASIIETKIISDTKVEIYNRPKPGVVESPGQCKNRIGTYEAVARVFSNKFPTIDHPVCIHKGDDHCRYIIEWEELPSLFWKKIRNYVMLASIILAFVFLFFTPFSNWLIATLLLTTTISGMSFYAELLRSKELTEALKNEGSLANNLMDQVNTIHNNSLLIQEIGQATSSILNIDELLKFTMDTLEKRLDFDRGLIMLANRGRTRLIYTVGYGYDPELEEFLRNTEFHLDKPFSKGEFVIAFKEQKPILVNDVSTIKDNLSVKSKYFLDKMGTKSFICLPIVYEGISEGVLAVDNIRSKRPFNQSDLSLLMGIAPQIGISINNARAYELIREREESFRALSENAPDIIYTLDINGAFTYVNPAWEKILGHSKEKVIGKYFIDFVREEDVKVFIDLFKEVRNKAETLTDFNGVLMHQNGSERLFNMNGAPNFDSEGNTTGLVGILKDITEQYNMEVELRQAQKMQAIGTLSAGIAHDFNNILTPIIGYTELIMSENQEQTQTKWMMERILNASHRAKELVRQILTFSRQTEQERKPVQISLIIKEALRLLRASLPTTIEIRQNIASESLVVGDPTQIHQVLMNLCTNAGHAMQEKGGILEVSLTDVHLEEELLSRHPKVIADSYVRLTVSDTGHGMPNYVLERIFDPFFTTKERSKGTGMGLSVVHGIVENHGGIISVSSEPGKGATFNVYLPVFIDETMIAVDSEKSLPEGSERILLVDDELPVVETGKHVLETLGYDVTTRTSSVEALELFKVKPDSFDLVITDMTMPNMTGDKLAKELLNIRPDIPIIICTGYSSLINKEKAQDMGIRAYIMKPMLTHEIAKTIRNVLSNN